MMRIVGLVGPKRSGKSTAAEALVRERGFVSISFADALKELALKVNPTVTVGVGLKDHIPLATLVERIGWDGSKEWTEVRRFLQELGTGVRDIDPNLWVNTWADKAAAYLRGIVVPDVRFSNEAEYLRENGALLIRITRPGLNDGDRHISETEQAGIECDVELVNKEDVHHFESLVLHEVDSRLVS